MNIEINADTVLDNLKKGILPKNHKEREIVLEEYSEEWTIPNWCKIVRLLARKPKNAYLKCSGYEGFNGTVSIVENGEILMSQPKNSPLVLFTPGCTFTLYMDGESFTSWILADEMPGSNKKTWFPRKAMELAEDDGNVVKLPNRYLKGFGLE